MNKTFNIILLALVPFALTMANYIGINIGEVEENYFLLGFFVLILIGLTVNKVPLELRKLVNELKIEIQKIHWIKHDSTVKNIFKLLTIIVVCGFIIAGMDKLISSVIMNTILSV